MEVLRQQIPNRWGFEIGIGCVNNLAQMFTGIAHNDRPRIRILESGRSEVSSWTHKRAPK
jgi:hypothetical protein